MSLRIEVSFQPGLSDEVETGWMAQVPGAGIEDISASKHL